jgi:hypothetical protein
MPHLLASHHLKQQSKQPRENAKTRLACAAALYPKPHSLATNQQQQQQSLGLLQQLTHAIDEQLLQKTNNFSSKPMMQPQDSMSSLLDFNTEHENTKSCYTVALVFDKALQQDQVTVEYAARIQTLVQYMMQEQQQVHVIGFCGTKH